MAKEEKIEKIEREYIIPIRKKAKITPRYQKANRAIRIIKQFLVRHMKVRDRDTKKIKIDKYLNEMVWFRGIKKPPAKIKVRAIKEGDIVRVEAAELMRDIKFKKARHEKREKQALESSEKKKIVEKQETPVEQKTQEKKEISEEEKEKEVEKEKSVKEAGAKIAEEQHKQAKHEAKVNVKQPKRPRRQVMNK